MSFVSLSKLQQVIPQFVDQRLLPSAPSHIKWILGGSTFIICHKLDEILPKYLPVLKALRLVTEQNKLDLELVKGFINSAFDKSGKVEIYGFILDKSDGEAFISLLETYKDADT